VLELVADVPKKSAIARSCLFLISCLFADSCLYLDPPLVILMTSFLLPCAFSCAEQEVSSKWHAADIATSVVSGNCMCSVSEEWSGRLDEVDNDVKCCGFEGVKSAWRDGLVDRDVPDDCEDESVCDHCVDDPCDDDVGSAPELLPADSEPSGVLKSSV